MPNAYQLVRLFWRPAASMSAILDQGSLLFASSAVVIVSVLLELSLKGAVTLQLTFVPLLGLAIAYVPVTLLLTTLIGQLGGASVVFQRDYSSLLTCAGMAWATVNIPIAIAGWILPLPLVAFVAIPAYLYFLVLMFFAVRTVFGTENRIAAGVAGVSWIPLLAAPFLWKPLSFILGWLSSPFILFFAFYYLRGELSSLGAGMHRRQNLRRNLEAAAVNPHDGDAQYQLGLIYQERRQYTEAIQRFKNAVAIDPSETDAHFQLGRIALEQGRLNDTLECFRTVYEQDAKHSSSEILRGLGELYVAARQYADAIERLEVYIERRPYDPEGLYFFGFALEQSGDVARAREMYERATEAARIAPQFRRRYTAQWSRRAQKQLRKLK
ncbi:MAG TPA: tetratricopeptide repeat protein [Bryobacteraceae bacterium]